jgi:hypothetical protein
MPLGLRLQMAGSAHPMQSQLTSKTEPRLQREATIYRMVVGIYLVMLLGYGGLTLLGVVR